MLARPTETILASPALAGHVLVIRSGREWSTYDINPGGELLRRSDAWELGHRSDWRGLTLS